MSNLLVVSAWVAGANLSYRFLESYIRLWLGHRSLCLLDLFIIEIWPICRDLEILYDVYWSDDMYTLEMYDLYPLRLIKIYICMLKFAFVDDVVSISWIYTLFACFIALLETGHYRNNLYSTTPFDYTIWYHHI